MSIIKQYHKDTDTTYVYESESYWDPEKGQARSNRRLIGKLDPETGEIVPTGKRGRKPKNPVSEAPASDSALMKRYQESASQVQSLEKQVKSQQARIIALESENKELRSLFSKFGPSIQQMNSIYASFHSAQD